MDFFLKNEIISLEDISKGGIESLFMGIFTHNLKIELVKKQSFPKDYKAVFPNSVFPGFLEEHNFTVWKQMFCEEKMDFELI